MKLKHGTHGPPTPESPCSFPLVMLISYPGPTFLFYLPHPVPLFSFLPLAYISLITYLTILVSFSPFSRCHLFHLPITGTLHLKPSITCHALPNHHLSFPAFFSSSFFLGQSLYIYVWLNCKRYRG